jgi:hypothetical protein
MYVAVFGPVPEGRELDHRTCSRSDCVNPRHMDVTTHRGNVLRGESLSSLNAAKTHCPQNHEYNDANTYLSKGGMRLCRVCQRIRAKARRDAVRDGIPYVDPFRSAA